MHLELSHGTTFAAKIGQVVLLAITRRFCYLLIMYVTIFDNAYDYYDYGFYDNDYYDYNYSFGCYHGYYFYLAELTLNDVKAQIFLTLPEIEKCYQNIKTSDVSTAVVAVFSISKFLSTVKVDWVFNKFLRESNFCSTLGISIKKKITAFQNLQNFKSKIPDVLNN